jgi:hypothetical protein
MKVSTENDNNFGYEKNTMLVDFLNFLYLSEAKSIFSYHASSPDAAAWILKFVFVYLANTAVLCYSLTIICCCQVQNYRESVNAWKKADFDGFREKEE